MLAENHIWRSEVPVVFPLSCPLDPEHPAAAIAAAVVAAAAVVVAAPTAAAAADAAAVAGVAAEAAAAAAAAPAHEINRSSLPRPFECPHPLGANREVQPCTAGVEQQKTFLLQ